MSYPKLNVFSYFFAPLCLAALLVGCEEANHDLADPAGPDVEVPIAVDPIIGDRDPDRVIVDGTEDETDVNIDLDRDRRAVIDEDRREERGGRIREALDNVDVNVDGEGTDVQVGDGEINVDSQ